MYCLFLFTDDELVDKVACVEDVEALAGVVDEVGMEGRFDICVSNGNIFGNKVRRG